MERELPGASMGCGAGKEFEAAGDRTRVMDNLAIRRADR